MSLTPKQKLAYQLHRRQGMAQKDVAKALDVTPAAVCRLVHRADARIAGFIHKCGGTGQCLILESLLA